MSEIRRKLVIVGDGYCGKTTLLVQLTLGYFRRVNILTIFDNYVADIEVDGKHVELALWDTSGLEDYDLLRPLSYPETHVVVICFAIDSPDSLENVQEKWIAEVRHFCPGIPIIFVGCKSDHRYDPKTIERLRQPEYNQHPVTHEEGMEVSKKIGAMMYLECSSATGAGVREVFLHATRAALQSGVQPKPLKLAGIKGLFGLFENKPKDSEKDSNPVLEHPVISSKEAEKEITRYLASAPVPQNLRIFRILIIGKTGCGKTTILSKVSFMLCVTLFRLTHIHL
ncbi:ras-domain-containing protein [Gymnopus androsaceus JB14]|uniref:Ras-domain-containing protein n=1 Tax=Gymnopus androsaceus JB14 TaxID=1447944 RepID=A0A6A4IJK6_9AGAR|nr:ras-domain-containing protein [Gymnopus androsaceus JB14]